MRTVEVVCVPWQQLTEGVADTGGERVMRGTFDRLLAHPEWWPLIELRDGHTDDPLAVAGFGVEFRDEPVGLVGVFRFAEGLRGPHAWAQMMAGAYRGVSVAMSTYGKRSNGGMHFVTAAELDHVALVDRPAYRGAIILDAHDPDDPDAGIRAFFARRSRASLTRGT